MPRRPPRRRRTLLTCVVSLLAGFAGPGSRAGQATPETLEIGVFENVALSRVGQAVVERAYEKLGIAVKTRPMPLRRSLQQANAGEIDGDLMRSAMTLKDMDQMIMIKVPVARVVFGVYRRGTCPARIAIDELRNARVAYVRGTRVLEVLLPTSSQLATVSAWDTLRYVQKGIADYAAVDEMESDALLSARSVPDICKVAEPILTTELYHSLNKRHAELAVRVEHVLKEMTDSGEVARIWAAETKKARESLAAP